MVAAAAVQLVTPARLKSSSAVSVSVPVGYFCAWPEAVMVSTSVPVTTEPLESAQPEVLETLIR